MIKLFGSTDTDFTSNGDMVLKPLLAVIHKEDNGDYYLELETGTEYVDELTEGRIIVANTPQDDQPFRINNVYKSTSKVKVTCPHVYFDSKNYLVNGATVQNMDCGAALKEINSHAQPNSPFKTISDVLTVNSMDVPIESLYEAFEGVREAYGGHLVRDGFSVGIQSEIGRDNGVLVQYKKNLKDITSQEDWDSVVTELLPVGKDGIMLNSLNASTDPYVRSSMQYDIPYTKTVSFSQNIDPKDYETDRDYQVALIGDLRRQAEQYVADHCLPQVNYTLSANVERVTDIGDVIAVRDKRLGVDMVTQVIAYDYDCIFKRFTKLEFGNFSRSIRGLAKEIRRKSTVDFVQYVNKGTLIAEIKINGQRHFIYAP